MEKTSSLVVASSLEFKQIFADSPIPEFHDLVTNIPSSVLMEIVAHFNALIYSHETEVNVQIEILEIWLSRLSNEIRTKISTIINDTNSGTNSTFTFFTNQTSLIFIEKIIINFHAGESRKLTQEEEERIFKAYLLCAQEWIDRQKWEYNDKEKLTPENMIKLLLPIMLPFEDIKSFKDFRWQIYKGIKVFSFIEDHEILGNYLEKFYSKFKISHWHEYFREIVGAFINLFDAGSKSLLITKPEDKVNAILDELAIDVNNFEIKNDFISLREKPVYKTGTGKYIIFNYSFFVDKIFQSLLFDFSIILKDNGIITNFPELKSKFISELFMEQYLLYDIINYMIGKRKNITNINGADWEEKIGEKGPDYYIRCGNKIFLIELKDAIFKAEAKISNDYNLITDELEKKVKINEKGKRKGITQLAYWVNNISHNGLPFEKFNPNDIVIYPILIITDESFNSFGINYILNQQYQVILDENGKTISKDLLVIHIDKLIELQDLFHDRKIPPQHIMEWFYNFIKEGKGQFDPFLSFSNYVVPILSEKGIKYDPMPRRYQTSLKMILKE